MPTPFLPRDPSAYLELQRLFRYLPVPLVGSVAFNGAKETKVCTEAAYTAFEQLFEMVQPTSILEIGTHAGHSSALMLAFNPRANVVSVDIGGPWIGQHASFADWGQPSSEGGLLYVQQILRAHYGEERFKLLIGDSTGLQTLQWLLAEHQVRPFDFAFIDGNHMGAYVQHDIEMALRMGIRNIVVDDLNSADGSEVWQAAQATGLQLVREWPELHSGRAGFGLMRAP